jgi:TatD DNase family protein
MMIETAATTTRTRTMEHPAGRFNPIASPSANDIDSAEPIHRRPADTRLPAMETVGSSAVPLVDIHSHGQSRNPGIRILDASRGEPLVDLPSQEYLSVGLHPWLDPALATEAAFARLAAEAAQARVLAVGECGLDRLVNTPLSVQAAIFSEHIRIAEGLGKPLVIHCVRAFDELARLVKSLKPKVPMILHGFNNRAEIARLLLRQGFYLSFGRALLNPGSGASQAFVDCPRERIFLETDDSAVGIEAIYGAASRLGRINPEALRQALFDNFRRVFHG